MLARQQACSDDVYTESLVFTVFTLLVWHFMLNTEYKLQLRLILATKIIRHVTF